MCAKICSRNKSLTYALTCLPTKNFSITFPHYENFTSPMIRTLCHICIQMAGTQAHHQKKQKKTRNKNSTRNS